MKRKNNLKNYFLLAFFLFFKQSFSQDTVFVYDISAHSLSYKLLPAYNVNAVSDSTNPSFGIYGVTAMPTTAPVDTYPNSGISLIKKAADIYTSLNYPFTAVTLIRYGLNITASVIGRRALLAFQYDVYGLNPPLWRNLHDTNPFYEDGTIQYGAAQLHPVRYYTMHNPETTSSFYSESFSVIEVAEDIGNSSGYFGLAFDTTLHSYDSLLLYNISYPAEGYPQFYSSPVNGDTLCFKYGYVSNPDSDFFRAYKGGSGEYVSPFFDEHFRIRGIRWDYLNNLKIGRNGFYFLKYVVDSLATGVRESLNVQKWNIYPNPVSKTISITFSQPLRTEATLYLINGLGQTIKTFQLSAGETKFEEDVSELAKGIYFASIRMTDYIQIGKFIKQ